MLISTLAAVLAATPIGAAGAPAPLSAPTVVVEPLIVTPPLIDPLLNTHAPEDVYGRRQVAIVYLNGEGPFRFVVDTGANRSAVSRKLAEQLSLSVTGKAVVNSLLNAEATDLVMVNRLSTGALRRGDVQMPILGPDVMAGADGMLGVDGFKDKRLSFDFKTDRMVVATATGARAPAGYWPISGKLRFGQLIVVPVRIGGVEASAIVDTGSQVTLANTALWQRLGARRGEDAGRITLISATGESLAADARYLPDMSIGKLALRNVRVAFGDFHIFDVWELTNRPAIVLGMDVLGQLDGMAIDYRRRELQLRLKNARAPDSSTRLRRDG